MVANIRQPDSQMFELLSELKRKTGSRGSDINLSEINSRSTDY